MKCYEVQKLLVAYLEGDTSPGERAAIEAHLEGCAVCQMELAGLSAARQAVGMELHHLGDHAEPPLQAWEQLEARLAKEDRRMKAQPGLLTNADAHHSGETLMSGRSRLALGLTVSGAVIAAALVLVGYFVFKPATPVSAQEIIQRAQEAQAAPAQKQGIVYWHSERYQDFQVLASGTPDGDTLETESYENLSTSQYRSITTNTRTGYRLTVSGFDGTNLFQSGESETATGVSPLIVYKATAPEGWVENYGIHNGPEIDQKAVFEQMKQQPDVEYVGQEKWVDGRMVHVVRSTIPLTKFVVIASGSRKVSPIDDANAPKGIMTGYFDTKTYDMVENKITATVNGQEVVITDFKTLANNAMPDGTKVAWDFSDVNGIQIVDDPTGEKTGGPWIVNTTVEEMASRGLKVYKLKSIPAGFKEHVTGSQAGAQEQLYMVEYKNADGGFADIQSGEYPQGIIDQPNEVYTTSSGLTVYFQGSDEPEVSTHKPFWFVAVKAPDTTFVITSNLPLATLKEMAEDLVEVK